MKLSFSEAKDPKSGVLVLLADKDAIQNPHVRRLDGATGGAISKAIKSSRWDGKATDILDLLAPNGIDASRIILAGLGDVKTLKVTDFERLGGRLAKYLQSAGDPLATILLDNTGADLPLAEQACALATGAMLRSYRFDKYRTKEPKSKKPTLKELVLASADHKKAQALFNVENAVVSGVFLTRDLVSEPANILYPESFAKIAQSLGDDGIDVEVLNEKEMRKLGMNALLGVGQGSERESRLVVMRWNGGDPADQPIAFVGKGVTFDTGGISIKPAEGMEQMKWDMGGAGIVTGLMRALARRKAKANVVGVIGLVENMPSGSAQRPGDVVTSMSGQTIEVINTDAEGRLVLADALWYTQDRFKPTSMIDLATLTGAIIISLGHEYAGYFTADEGLSAALYKAGDQSGDKVWRMPLADEYDKLINCDIADMKNVGGRAAGSITAAQFLKRFSNDVPWVHIDVAGMVWSDKEHDLYEKGATGFGVRLLDRYVRDHKG
ncbi:MULTISPECIES: leucyl aminopeptidase [unclassified Iodidimonas]|jgi:leucyl aminopeptidase|uniref:leucyl aminopeptidase n=1 Tax=unclassified Iodidimonas TaxID=2626145 RepID=UPI00248252DB|nr:MULTISPECIES: leucyl aminopeptidase [unclassified Iodidimonas]